VESGARWPNLFVVGVGKCGTTSLWHCLDAHPDVFMARVKEPKFFTNAHFQLVPRIGDVDAYLRLFEGSAATLRGEASAAYFWDSASPGAIHRRSPGAHILVILRDPVARAESHHADAARYGVDRRTFEAAVDDELAGSNPPGVEPYLARSMYSDGLRRFLDTFGDAVDVVFFEDFVADDRGEVERLYRRLGLDPARAPDVRFGRHNERAVPRNRLSARLAGSAAARRVARRMVPERWRPAVERKLFLRGAAEPVAARVQERLARHFAEDGARLEEILGRRPPWRDGSEAPS
jgi:hypothetical protein